MTQTHRTRGIQSMLVVAGFAVMILAVSGTAQDKKADDKAPAMSYTVTKQKAILKVVLKNSPLGPEYEMKIDTTPKSTGNIRNEVPVAVSYKIKETTVDIDLLPGARGIKSVKVDGKKVPLAKAVRPPTKAKEGKGDKDARPATAEEKAAALLAGAKEAIASKNVTLARLRLRSIVTEYAKTGAAKEAEKLLKTLPK